MTKKIRYVREDTERGDEEGDYEAPIGVKNRERSTVGEDLDWVMKGAGAAGKGIYGMFNKGDKRLWTMTAYGDAKLMDLDIKHDIGRVAWALKEASPATAKDLASRINGMDTFRVEVLLKELATADLARLLTPKELGR